MNGNEPDTEALITEGPAPVRTCPPDQGEPERDEAEPTEIPAPMPAPPEEDVTPPDPPLREDEPDADDTPVSEAPVPADHPQTVRPVLAWFRLAVPWTLSGIVVLVFAASALAFLRSADYSREALGTAAVGYLFGGRGCVTVSHPSAPLLTGMLPPRSRDMPAAQDKETDCPHPAASETDTVLPEPEESPETVNPDESAEETGDIPPEIPEDAPPRPLRFTNETGYDPDPEEILALPRAVPPLDELRAEWGPDAPLVLILHTHGTEAFAECADNDWRSRDPALSVMALGERLAERLREAEIPAIHLTSLYDVPDFNMAYYNAALAIREALTLAPSISYILDIHRDSVTFPDGTVYAPVTDADGVRSAQLMFVVGTDEAGADHPGWRDNLALALRLQTALSDRYPTLMRDVNLRSASFNEQYAKGSLLIEAGAAGCTLDEALASVDLLADALIGEIRGEG